MLPYLIPIILTLLSSIIFDINNKKNGKYIWWILYIYLTLLIGLRFEVGGDTINYMGYYEWQKDLDDFSFDYGGMLQPGYNFICAVAKSISPKFYVFQIIHVIIVNTLLFIFIDKNTKYRFASLFCCFFVCYFYFTCEILREVIAVLIFAFLYKPLQEKKWAQFYGGVAICTLFHLSAIILIIFPFLLKIKFSKSYIYVVMITIIGMVFLNKILGMAQNFLLIGDKIAGYASENHGFLADFLTFLRRGLFPIAFALLVKYGCKRKLLFENQIAVLGIFGIMAFFNPVIFGRVTNYLILFFVIAFATEIVRFIKSSSIRLHHNAMILGISFLILYSSYYMLYNMYRLYVPYTSIINPISYHRDNVSVFNN